MIRNIKIGARSALAFGLLGFITLVLGVFAIMQLAQLNAITDTLAGHRLPALNTATALRRDILRTRALLNELSDAQSAAELQALVQQIKVLEQDYLASEQKMSQLVRTPEARAIFAATGQAHDNFVATLPQLFLLSEQGKASEALTYRRNVVAPSISALTNELNTLAEFQLQRSEQLNKTATDTYQRSKASLITGIIITIILLTVLAFYYSRSLILPLRYAVGVARKVASGDLTEQIIDNHQDEAADMLRALADMQKQLRQTLALISDSSQQLATTSEELSVVTNQSTLIVTQQSDQLEQAATAVNELTAAIEEVARNANSTSDNAEIADEKTQLGQAKINETIKTIESLAADIKRSASGVTALAGNIKNIGSVLDVIRAIADQTNLLALNAAIEAARAGDSGRGFAVVADEVRALAHRTQQSTKEIEQMIQAVQHETNQAVSNMNTSNQRAEATLVVANDAGVAFSEITRLISQISDQNMTIASAAEEQTTVAREVDKNLLQIRDFSVQTAAGANETNASSNELAKLAEQLNELVLRFKI